MNDLRQISEQLASALVLADADDPRSLARVCGALEAIHNQVAEAEAPEGFPRLQSNALTAAKLLEAVVLEESNDLARALEACGEVIRDLRRMLGGSDADLLPIPAVPESARVERPKPAQAASEAAAPVAVADVQLVTEFIAEAGEHLESGEQALLKLESEPDDAESINAVFRSFHTIKGVAGFLNLGQISSLAHGAESLLDLARQGKARLQGPLMELTLQSLDRMRALLEVLRQAVAAGQAPATDPSVGQLVANLQQATEAIQRGETTFENFASGGRVGAAEASGGLEAAGASAGAGVAGEHPGTRRGSMDATVKVATTRLDSLVNMVGELLIAQSMVREVTSPTAASNPRLARSLSHLGKITRELQDLSMSMRMVPIQGTFQKMGRLVRDLAKKAGKDVELVLSGGETELDRNVVEAISDPLVHMVRNAVDHGLEPPAEREAAGKPRMGRVELRASQQGGSILIEITDNGRGLNREKILRKAVDAGIVPAGADLSDAEVYDLIFHAGLSTADRITDVSGRGVGMDVVKRNVEALRGRIEIATKLGAGSTFTIRLPLTLAMIDGMVVRVGDSRYILPLTSIEQSIRPAPGQVTTVQGRGEMCKIRDALLPMFRLYEIFGVAPTTTDPTQALVVAVQDNDRRCCLLVDELLGQQQVVIKSLTDSVGAVRGISGGAILGDGSVSLILDVPGLMSLASQGRPGMGAWQQARAAAGEPASADTAGGDGEGGEEQRGEQDGDGNTHQLTPEGATT